MSHFISSILMFLSSLGYFGIALGLMIEIIPSEIVLAYGGYMISKGMLNYPLAVVSGVIGGTIAQLFLYWAGYYGGRPFLEKYGKYVLIRKKQIDLSEKWFEKYGAGVIFSARFIPVVRHAISIPAGIAKMPMSKFTLYTVAAILPWTVLFLYLGEQLGTRWQTIKAASQQYALPIMIVAVILGVIYYLIKRKK
jgi:membrane protein DedA with SNARE-associated domain